MKRVFFTNLHTNYTHLQFEWNAYKLALHTKRIQFRDKFWIVFLLKKYHEMVESNVTYWLFGQKNDGRCDCCSIVRTQIDNMHFYAVFFLVGSTNTFSYGPICLFCVHRHELVHLPAFHSSTQTSTWCEMLISCVWYGNLFNLSQNWIFFGINCEFLLVM